MRTGRQDVANSRFFGILRTILKKKTDGFAVSLKNRYTDFGSNVLLEARAQRANVPEFFSYEYTGPPKKNVYTL
jgi:hypothetical protein